MGSSKNYSVKLSILITFFIVMSLSGCLSEWQGDLAKIVISFGSADRAANYVLGDYDTYRQLKHEIVLTSETEKKEYNNFSGTTFEVYVAPGSWNVSVYSYLDGKIYAIGSKDVVLKLGQNNEKIKMYEALFVTFYSNGGSDVPEQIVGRGSYATKPSPDPTHNEGFSFAGWYLNNEDDPFIFDSRKIDQSIILHARWNDPNTEPSGEENTSIVVINEMEEWELLDETVSVNAGETRTFIINGTYKAYKWYLNGDPVGNGTETYTFITSQTGEHEVVVVVTDENGESRSGSCRVIVH